MASVEGSRRLSAHLRYNTTYTLVGMCIEIYVCT